MSLKFVGQLVACQYSTDAGTTWKHLMSTTKKDFKNATDEVDVTSDSSGSFKEKIDSFMEPSLSCEGFSTLAAETSGQGSYKELQALQLAKTKFTIRIVDDLATPVSRNLLGVVFIKSLGEAFDTGKAVTFKVDFTFVNGYVNS